VQQNGEHSNTMKSIRAALGHGALSETFTPADVNRVLRIDWAGTFLPKHRVRNPGGYTEHFVRVAPGLYRLR